MVRTIGTKKKDNGSGVGGHGDNGFTLIELTVVLVLVSVVLALAAFNFSGYQSRTAARSGAQLFARDLTLARSAARRGREGVVVRFHEGSRWYTVTTDTGRELVRRRFGAGRDVVLSEIDLDLPGDSLVFDGRGVAGLHGATLGSAAFTAGNVEWEVSFNAMGASKVAER